MKDLKKKREKLGLTQVEVARKVGVSLSGYLLWERGAGKPNAENKEKLKKVLKMK
jgi:transcriptional regulator with XRE-family HTH domain